MKTLFGNASDASRTLGTGMPENTGRSICSLATFEVDAEAHHSCFVFNLLSCDYGPLCHPVLTLAARAPFRKLDSRLPDITTSLASFVSHML